MSREADQVVVDVRANAFLHHMVRNIVGSLVLATTGPEDGWYEAVVIKVEAEILTLRWRDYPDEGTLHRRAGQLGLRPPGQP